VFAAILVVYCGAQIFLLYEYQRAKTFLVELHSIQLGQSEESLQVFLEKYENREWEQVIHSKNNVKIVSVDPWHFQRSFWPSWLQYIQAELINVAPDIRRDLGLRVWQIQGSLTFKDSRVRTVNSGLLVEGENEWLWGESWLVGAFTDDIVERYQLSGTYRTEMKSYVTGWSHLHMGYETGEVFRNNVTSQADDAQLAAARTYNMECLISFSGCRSLCELMPKAAEYMREHRYPGLGSNSGSWGPQDQSCYSSLQQ
jgi:hypothetical protein